MVTTELEMTTDAILVTNSSTEEITYVSEAFCNHFNMGETELIGIPLQTIMSRHANKTSYIKFVTVLGQACLMREIIRQDDVIYHILMNEQDGDYKELVSFINFIDSKKYKKKSIKQSQYDFQDIIGDSPAINRVKDLSAKIAINNSTVLLTGESGTGKELFAQAIHGLSSRKNEPFIAVNCVAIPDDLFESELFGYESGAFSGANKEGKPGKIELAQNGTLFLDEISELTYPSQGKLLRVLQEREVERLGGTTTKSVDIRIIAATNRDLKQMVDTGKFRADLFYRLYVFDFRIPPLRERREDILQLVEKFIENYNRKFDKRVIYIDGALEEWLLSHEWPGNVRELKASIERGMNVVEGDTLTLREMYLTVDHHPVPVQTPAPLSTPFESLEDVVEQAEVQAIKQALQETDGNRNQAAQKLKIHAASLYRKIKKYNL